MSFNCYAESIHLNRDFISPALLAADKRVRQLVVDKRIGTWIKHEFAVETQSDVDRVTDRKHAVMGRDVGDRRLTRLHTVEEIVHVSPQIFRLI